MPCKTLKIPIKFIVERIEGKAVETIRTQEVEPIKILDLDEEYE